MATSIPKAILYYNPASVWASAALLGLEEKGYGSDEVELKVVDLANGENFAPAYIRINPNGTVPTLVVPFEKSLPAGIPNKYRALTDTKSVLEFLDKSRSAISKTHTTSSAPAPALAPATISLAEISNNIITLLHSVPVNFLSVGASTPEGLSARASSAHAQFVHNRQTALQNYVTEESQSVNEAVKRLWETRHTENGFVVRVYEAADKPSLELNAQEKQERDVFFKKTVEVWNGIKNIFARLEKDMEGPYVLGDQFSLVDLHVAAWLTRVLFVSGAPTPSPSIPIAEDAPQIEYSGFPKLQETLRMHTGDESFVVGPKIRVFFESLKDRESWRQVYAEGLH
ncbi:hypothetical protein K439DRAFT_1417735 [Ramaria rubella]|nr:hypothetical protein K439DRAFT_1417735 [Ramaria rubella]